MNEGQSCSRRKGLQTPRTILAAFTHNQAQDCEPDKVGLTPLTRLLHISSAEAPYSPPVLGIPDVSYARNSFGCARRLLVHVNCTKNHE